MHDVQFVHQHVLSRAGGPKALSILRTLGISMTPDQVAAYDRGEEISHARTALARPGAARSDQGLSTAGRSQPERPRSRKRPRNLCCSGMIRVAAYGARRERWNSTTAAFRPPSYDQLHDAVLYRGADPRVYTFDQMTPAATCPGPRCPKGGPAFKTAVQRAEQLSGILTAPGAAPARRPGGSPIDVREHSTGLRLGLWSARAGHIGAQTGLDQSVVLQSRSPRKPAGVQHVQETMSSAFRRVARLPIIPRSRMRRTPMSG